MKVTLAYPIDGHEPDETIDVDDERGRTLLRDGFARPADADSAKVVALATATTVPPLNGAGSGRDEWAAYAQAMGVAITEEMTRAEIVRAVGQAGVPTEPKE